MRNPHHEIQIEAIARRVGAKLLRDAGAVEVAAKLEAAQSDAILELRAYIRDANKAWEQDARAVAIRDDEIFWDVRLTLEDSDDDGPIVNFHWGWDKDGDTPKFRTSGDLAFDLASDILDLFRNENGDPVRPIRPEVAPNPELSRYFDAMEPVCRAFMDATGYRGGVSYLDLSIWDRIGRPVPVPPHRWADHPEDRVRICADCHHWYSTNPRHDDVPTQVCPGAPFDDERISSVEHYDPRRSPALREAQRLDTLLFFMRHGGALPEELRPFNDALVSQQEQLTEQELNRFNRERAV